jgi:carbon monoxide dehydrogenase subunit G
VERIKVVDERTAELTVKEKIGVVPMIIDLRAQIESEDPPHKLHAIAKAEHLMMRIDVALQETASGTQLLTVFDVKGEGQLKGIVDRLFEKRATERTAQFADSLQSRFGAAAPALAPEPGIAGKPGTGKKEGILSRLWRRLRGWFAPARGE